MHSVDQLENQLEDLTIAILAAEDWAPTYSKDPKSHAALIKNQAKLERTLRTYFRGLGDRVPKYIKWAGYQQALYLKQQTAALQMSDSIKAAAKKPPQVDVNIFDPNDLDPEDDIFQQAVHDPILLSISIGAQAAQTIYKMELGLGPASQAVMQAAQTRTAALVGKKVLKDGTVVDNPNSKLNVNDTTRDQISQSISTSLQLNETVDEATDRLVGNVSGLNDDYARASMIASTESVNAYTQGSLIFGDQSGATGKEWYTAGAKDDICLDNESQGPINIDDSFDSGDDGPPGHPNCNCGMRLLYSNEFPGPDDGGDNSDIIDQNS